MSEHFVIVGAGQAGAQAAGTLRQKGFKGRVTLIGDETLLPYHRPPLSKKFLAGELSVERLLIRPASFFAAKQVDVRLRTQARSLHPALKELRLGDGETVRYDKLLLTTGSRVRRLSIPGHNLPGIHYLRSVTDVMGLHRHLKAGKRLLLIGGGYIGLEVAAVATQLGLKVTVLEALDRLMARVVSPPVSSFFRRRHEAAGVTIITDAKATGLVGDRRVIGVQTDRAGLLSCDLAIAGIGVEPEVTLAEQAGIGCSNGIRVDQFCRTSNPHVFAAGDCTSHPSALLGRALRLESVANAVEQSKVAAANMLGEQTPYEALPWFWSDQYDLKLQIAGIAEPGQQHVVRGDPWSSSFAVFYLREGRITAAEAVNRPRAFMASKKLIAEAVPISAESLVRTEKSMHEIAHEALQSAD